MLGDLLTKLLGSQDPLSTGEGLGTALLHGGGIE